MGIIRSIIGYVFAWQNSIYIASIIFSSVYIFVCWLGMDSDASLEADTDIDVETDVDVDTDVDIDTDAEVETDLETDTEIQAKPTIVEHGALQNILSFLGVGRCPLSIIIIVLGLVWGFLGLFFNDIFAGMKIIPPGLYFLPSVICATIGGVGITRLLSSFMARYLPHKGTTAISISSLVGSSGIASLAIDKEFGRATVIDKHGTSHTVNCFIRDGEDPISSGTPVLLLQYFPNKDMFLVSKKPELSDLRKEED